MDSVRVLTNRGNHRNINLQLVVRWPRDPFYLGNLGKPTHWRTLAVDLNDETIKPFNMLVYTISALNKTRERNNLPLTSLNMREN